MKTISRTIAGLSAAALVCVAGPVRAQDDVVSLAITGQGTALYSMGVAVAALLEDNGMQVRLQTMGSTTQYMPLLGTDEIDIGIVNINVLTDVWRGDAPFRASNTEARLVSVLYPFPVALYTHRDSEIRSVADVAGSRISGGFTQMPHIVPIIEALLASCGLTTADVTEVPAPTIVRGSDDFDAGRIDVAYFGVGGGRVAQSDAAVGGVRYLSVCTDDEAVEAMNVHIPGAHVLMLADGAFPGVIGDTPVMAYDMVMAAGANVDDAKIARVVEILAGGKEQLVEAFGAFRGFEPELMAKPDYEVPYHDGAIAFFEANGLWQQ